MRALLIVVLVCGSLVVAVDARAAGSSPVERTRALYAGYGGSATQPGVDMLTAKQRASWFTPRLVRLLQNDARCGELRDLDYDPLLGGQDPAVAHVDVATEDTEPGRQQVTARFDNGGKPQRVVLTWLRTRDGWRIDEIVMNDGKRVTDVLAEPCEPFAPR